LRIVIELDPGADLYVGVRGAQFFHLTKTNSGVKTIMVGKSNVVQTAGTCAVDPRLEKLPRVTLHAMSLRVGVVIREKLYARAHARARRRARRSRPTIKAGS